MAEAKTTTTWLRPSRSLVEKLTGEAESGFAPQNGYSVEFPLSNVDSIMPRTYTRLLFIYEVANMPPFQLQEDSNRADVASEGHMHVYSRISGLLRTSLEFTLDGYPILFGRLREDHASGGLSVLVKGTLEEASGGVKDAGASGASIRFVVRDERETSASFEELSREGFPMSKLDGDVFSPLALFPVMSSDGGSDGGAEVFAMQITYIKGGFVLCAAAHHSIHDGPGLASFMKKLISAGRSGHAVPTEHSEAFRRELTIEPDVVADLRNSSDDAKQRLLDNHPEYRVLPKPFSAPKTTTRPPPGALVENVAKIFTISLESLERLKAACQPPSGSEVVWVSTHDAICALIWRCVMKARFPDGDVGESRSILGQAVNSRSRISPPLPDDFLGSVNFYAASVLKLSEILEDPKLEPLKTLSIAVRKSINSKNDASIRSALKYIAMQSHPSVVIPSFTTVNDYTLTSWVAMFRSGDVDLDIEIPSSEAVVTLSCKACRVPKAAFDGLAIILPSFTDRKDGVEVLMGLKTTVMERLQADSEWSSYISRVAH